MKSMLIEQIGLTQELLKAKTVVITGAGGGIGYEAARALLWLGANVVIAEINQPLGSLAAESLGREFTTEQVLFVHTDVSDETSVRNLYRETVQRYRQVNAVINNATIAVLGKVVDLPIEQWDASYRVNLRGPVLMAKVFLPDMISRGEGTFVCVSSTGTAYLGGYETFKAAQVHLANTLDAETEGTGVNVFTIGPGLVPTETASSAVNQLAPLLGMSVEELFELNRNAVLTPEEAGTGFAVAMLKADQFRGMEISSLQALRAVNIDTGHVEEGKTNFPRENSERDQAIEQCERVLATLLKQSEDWKKRSLFERQWVIRDFKKTAGMSIEEWLSKLDRFCADLKRGDEISIPHLEPLAQYYDHLAELAKGYEKDPEKLEENLRHVYRWRDEVKVLMSLMGNEKRA